MFFPLAHKKPLICALIKALAISAGSGETCDGLFSCAGLNGGAVTEPKSRDAT
jgi:hypothetical protein